MHLAVRKNFEEKVSYVARMVTDMTVIDASSFLSVDCGFPSDTFNVVAVRDMSMLAQMLAGIDHFTSKGFPMAVWSWENDVDPANHSMFIQHGLKHAETNTSMQADLSELKITSLDVEGLEIKQAETTDDLLQFGITLAAGFGASDEGKQVLNYFQHLCEYPLNTFPAMRYYIGVLHDIAVATGTLFVGSETVGIYDITTSTAYRRRGIGSAMFQHILEDTRNCNLPSCVLQASPDGLGIYLRAGFRPVGDVHVFENRVLLY
jgi:ribosomal protein S18 acetylase RimI-like enzyme